MPAGVSRLAFLRLGAVALGIVCLVVMAWRLIDGTGHDYAYFLPRMLDSYLFLKANGLALQEYTASYCAGIFVFANPQTLSLSVPQVLLFAVDPVTTVRLTFVLFSILGAVGMHLCARRLGLDTDAALITAAVFAFSGFLITRMMVGHLAMHSVALAPLAAWSVMQAMHDHARSRRLAALAMLCTGALLLAIVIYSGGAALLPQTGVIVGFLSLVYALRTRSVLRWIPALAITGVLTLTIAAPKIEAALAVTANLPRDYYTLPGFTASGLVRFLAEGLFFVPAARALNDVLLNRSFFMDWHEFYYGLTPFALLVAVSPVFRSDSRRRVWVDMASNRWIVAAGIVCLLTPIALNLYTAGWNDVLKAIPVIGQSSNLIRWSVILVPLVALLAGYAANTWHLGPAWRTAAAAGLVVAMTGFQLVVPQAGLDGRQTYDPRDMVDAWTLIHRRNASPPPLTQIGMRLTRDDAGGLQAQWSPQMDHAFLQGASNALCYEPLFGYRLETYPFGRIRPGQVAARDRDGYFNLKNPACYVYPDANGCAPGDHFRVGEGQIARDLVDRKPISLAVSPRRKAADAFAVAGLALALAAATLTRIRRRTGG